jgi:hypothetical protein
VEKAANAAASLVEGCPAAAQREQQDALVRLGALEAALQRLSAGGSCGHAAAGLVAILVLGRPDVAGAAVAAGALPGLVALLGDADEMAAHAAAVALYAVVDGGGPPIAAAAVDAGAVRALAERLGRPGVGGAFVDVALYILSPLARTPAGAERLVADGALPHVVGLLRSPARDVADAALACLNNASDSPSWCPVAEALLADATAGPALVALLLQPGLAPVRVALVLSRTMVWAQLLGGPEALRQAGGLAAAVRRAGAVPRLVGLLRAPPEGAWRRFSATCVLGGLDEVCHFDAAAAREALGAGAWQEACRALMRQDACGHREEQTIVALSLSLLAELAPHLRDAAPRPAAAAGPGLVAALARAVGHAAARGPPGALAALSDQAQDDFGRPGGRGPGGSDGGRRRGAARRRVRRRGRRRPPGARPPALGAPGSWGRGLGLGRMACGSSKPLCLRRQEAAPPACQTANAALKPTSSDPN